MACRVTLPCLAGVRIVRWMTGELEGTTRWSIAVRKTFWRLCDRGKTPGGTRPAAQVFVVGSNTERGSGSRWPPCACSAML
jgi:hypothetical protein